MSLARSRALRSLALVTFGVLLLAAAACSPREMPHPVTATPPTAATATATPSATASPTDTAEYTIADPSFELLPGAEVTHGVHEGASYRIEVPTDWSGELVLFAHGFRSGATLSVSSPPPALRDELISTGVAWAASSYSANGYIPGVAAADTLALLDLFEERFGEAGRVYVVGESMGGHVATLLLENAPDRLDGGLAVCGAVAGQDVIDYLVSWAMVAEYTSGIPLSIDGPAASLAVALTERIPAALGDIDAPTEAGLRFQSIIRNLTGGPRPFFLEGMAASYVQNFALLLYDGSRAVPSSRAATNAGAAYDIDEALGLSDAEVNEGVRRIPPLDPSLRDPGNDPGTLPTTGQIEDPFLTLHTTGDLLVPISQEVIYAERVEAAGVDEFLVQRAIRAAGHCDFSDGEYLAGWRDLAEWVRDGVRPAGDDLSGDLSDAGLAFTNPLRTGDPGGE